MPKEVIVTWTPASISVKQFITMTQGTRTVVPKRELAADVNRFSTREVSVSYNNDVEGTILMEAEDVDGSALAPISTSFIVKDTSQVPAVDGLQVSFKDW